jgi:hypothetical protein
VTVHTPLDALVARLREQAHRYNPAIEAAPVAILWTDERREWEPCLDRLRDALPELHALGPYAPEARTGPGVWLRMVADRQAGSAEAGGVPILYLPGVGNAALRTDLRGVKDDPQLAPVAELQYRGLFWRQDNGKDWTLRAFLESERGGLGLRVSGDQETLQALKAAFRKLLTVSLAALQGQTVDAAYLDRLLNPEPAEDVLTWLTDPGSLQREKGEGWGAFTTAVRKQLGVDLAKGSLEVAQRVLASQPGEPAHALWEKYAAHWPSYPYLHDLFRQVPPPDLLAGVDRYPRLNEQEETRLADGLTAAAGKAPSAGAKAVLELERRHGARRDTLWARMGHAPLAQALEHLARIGRAVQSPLTGGSLAGLTAAWTEDGWQVDAAARHAMDRAQRHGQETPVYAVLHALYRRWLEKAAEAFQGLVAREGYPDWHPAPVPEGTCVLFVDGLRFDLARELEATLRGEGWSVSLTHGFTSVPSVTSSGKVWTSPAATDATGGAGPGLPVPRLPSGDYTAERLRKTLEAAGFTLVDTEHPAIASGRGWAELPGDIDGDGHAKGARLARVIPGHLEDLARTVRRLLAAGWHAVRMVTDHGWLLLPGGLPKAALHATLTETRWGRFAVLKDAIAEQDLPSLPWSFNPAVPIALAPGISVFVDGKEYDHGGLTLQESVVPVLEVRAREAPEGAPRIVKVTWNTRKTICTVTAAHAAGTEVSLERLGTPVGDGQALDAAGKGKVVFEEVDDLLGEPIGVVLRRDGQKIAEERIVFGEAWNGS